MNRDHKEKGKAQNTGKWNVEKVKPEWVDRLLFILAEDCSEKYFTFKYIKTLN
jgi:hypothetical protein